MSCRLNRQAQSRRPTLCLLQHPAQRIVIQIDLRIAVDEGPRLVVDEREIDSPKLTQLSPSTHQRKRQRRIAPRRQHHAELPGGVFEEPGQHIVDRIAGDDVIVVEHDHQRLIEFAEIVEQRPGQRRRSRRLSDVSGLVQTGQCTRHDTLDTLDKMREKDRKVIVTIVERHPHRRFRDPVDPLTHDHRLPEPSRRRDQSQRKPFVIEPIEEPRPIDGIDVCRRDELRGEDNRIRPRICHR